MNDPIAEDVRRRLNDAFCDALIRERDAMRKELEAVQRHRDSLLEPLELTTMRVLLDNAKEREIALIKEHDALRLERDALLAELGSLRAKEPPLLQCASCRNTESCAGAMARYFNQGRCLHCGGFFKVVRA